MMRLAMVFLVPGSAAAAGLAAGLAADWVAGGAAATAALMVAVLGMGLALRAVEERVLAEVEAPCAATDAERALAGRVGLDPVTVIQAKAAAKAAVRATLVRRGAGLAALCAARAPAAVFSARVPASARRASAAAGSSAPGTAAGSATSAAPEAESPSAVVLGLRAGSAAAEESAAQVERADPRDDVA